MPTEPDPRTHRGADMTAQAPSDVSAVIDGLIADRQVDGIDVSGVPREMVAEVEAAGLQSSVGTITFAGQNSNGGYSVQFDVQNGSGFSSAWPQWAFSLAKDALLANKRVWVGSNGDPFGSNLVFVLVLA
jgi:hypothetical protein